MKRSSSPSCGGLILLFSLALALAPAGNKHAQAADPDRAALVEQAKPAVLDVEEEVDFVEEELDTKFTGEDGAAETASLKVIPEHDRNRWALFLPLAVLTLLALNVRWRFEKKAGRGARSGS